MKKEISNILNEFAFKLQELSQKPVENLKIELPFENYKQLEYELNTSSYIPYRTDYSKGLSIQNITGVNMQITCKEIEDSLIQHKLQKCFKILRDEKTN